MLTFTEEILLLMLDDDGLFLPIRGGAVEHILAGAALMDLAFANRIDTDPEQLLVLDRTPTGNPMLDDTLERIAGSGETMDTRGWVDALARQAAPEIRRQALASLIDRGILEAQDERFLWVFRSRRYPMIDGRVEREAKLRIEDVLLSDDAPDPRGRGHDLPPGRLRHPRRHLLGTGNGARPAPCGATPQDGPHRPRGRQRHRRHRRVHHHGHGASGALVPCNSDFTTET